ncbi:MAG: hypothetical protein ACRCYB_09250 [Aeromonas veronii]
MTPCEKLGYKVGDKFEVVDEHYAFPRGAIIKLIDDDGSDAPFFEGERTDGATTGCCILFKVKPVSQRAAKPISKSKRQLAQLLIEAGVTQFPEGANWAAQDKGDCCIWGYVEKSFARSGDWHKKTEGAMPLANPTRLVSNWHQTVLSRDEFDQIVAETSEPDADGWIEWGGGECPVGDGSLIDVTFRDGTVQAACKARGEKSEGHRYWTYVWACTGHKSDIIAYRLHKPEQVESQYCESVTRSIPEPTAAPTLDQLLQDWRNADDYAQRKQTEADEASAMRDERWQAVQARAGEMGVTVGRCEPEWVEWKGGEQPVEDGTLIDVKFRDGMEMFAVPVGVTPDDFPRHVLDWSHDDRRGDIVAYRLTRP